MFNAKVITYEVILRFLLKEFNVVGVKSDNYLGTEEHGVGILEINK